MTLDELADDLLRRLPVGTKVTKKEIYQDWDYIGDQFRIEVDILDTGRYTVKNSIENLELELTGDEPYNTLMDAVTCDVLQEAEELRNA